MMAEQKSETILNLERAIDIEQEVEEILPISQVLETKHSTCAILNLEQAVEKFSQEVRPLLDPTSEENRDGEKLKSRELAILVVVRNMLHKKTAFLVSGFRLRLKLHKDTIC